MQVSIIIPLYNCLALTQAMLASLRSTLPAGFSGEIILVDDGSTDGTRTWLGTLPADCRAILNEKNLGFAATCNRGAAAAQGEILFFLNNDLVLLPHWLEPMLAAFTRLPDAGLVGNVQRNAATGAIDHSGVFFNHKGKPEHDTVRPLFARLTGYRRVSALTGACFAVRRATWRQLGGFDEGFRNGAEDVDLCLRASATGLQHYIALRSIVRHHISQSTGRKLRDEQNTHRLVLRWQETIAGKIGRAWCRHHLETYWPDPRDFPDQALARQAFYHLLHLRPQLPAGARLGTRQAIALELERWEKLSADSG
jgi:GT2 family glycosyltransferase